MRAGQELPTAPWCWRISATVRACRRCADGRSVDTSMGFTPIGGVVDEHALGRSRSRRRHLHRANGRIDADQVEHELSHDRGCSASPDQTGDMRELLAREETDEACRLAVAMSALRDQEADRRLSRRRSAGSTRSSSPAASASTRPRFGAGSARASSFSACGSMTTRNAANSAVISTADAPVAVRVIPTDEEV